MESTTSNMEQALYLAVMGNHNAALALLPEGSSQAAAAKAAILISLGQYQKAVDTVEAQPSENVYARLQLARALFLNGESERAAIESQKLKEQLAAATTVTQADEAEHRDLIHQVEVLSRKVQLELSKASRVGNINDAAYLPTSKPAAAAEASKPVP